MSSHLDALSDFEERLGHRFADRSLLEQALTHSSHAHEAAARQPDNEPLEYLGDALLGFLVADALHRRDPEGEEGAKSKSRALLVAEPSLARQAEALGIPALLRLGRGEEGTGGRAKKALWADAYEAVLAATYLDGGIEAARRVVERGFAAGLDAGGRASPGSDFKTSLQERLQAEGRPRPEYRLRGEEGPPHRRRFRVVCVIEGTVAAEGEGRSKKQAEQAAAERALRTLVSP